MYEDTVGVSGQPERGAFPTLPRFWFASPVHYVRAHGGKGDTFCWCAILRHRIRTRIIARRADTTSQNGTPEKRVPLPVVRLTIMN